MKRKIRVMASLLAATLLFGCGKAGEKQKEVTVILKNNTAPFFLSMAEGAKKAGEDLGVSVTIQAPAGAQDGSGNEEQTQMVEQAIASQADCVVLCPIDSEAIRPAVKKLNEANVPIVDLNTQIYGDDIHYETFVAIENYEVGYEAAKALCDAMNGQGNMYIIEGTVGNQTSIDRVKGAQDAIAEYPEITIVAQQSANGNRAQAMDVVQNLLQSYPDVDAIFCQNDEMALGSAEAVAAGGKSGQVYISGVDANADAVKAVKDGTIYVTIDSQPYEQGYKAVEAAAKIIQGETVESYYRTDVKLYTKENIDEKQ